MVSDESSETAEGTAVSNLELFYICYSRRGAHDSEVFQYCMHTGHLFMQDVFTVSWVNVISLYKYLQYYAVS